MSPIVCDQRPTAESHPRSNSSRTRKKICFVSGNAYLALANTSVPRIGGAEVQQAIIARHFRDAGHQVSFITKVFDGRHHDEVVDGIEIFKGFDDQHGVPGFRFFYPRLFGLWRALKRADADIYYQRCAENTTGICSFFCRQHNRTFIYAGASYTDFTEPRGLNVRDRLIYRWGLRHAGRITVQSHQQLSMLKKNHGLDGHIVRNIYPARQLSSAKGYVLWVGRIQEIKRPLLCLEIARRFPQTQFIMIGGRVSGADCLAAQIESHGLPNVKYLGFQPLAETERYFDSASLLLNTSRVEGFPNTFLQAWSRGIPTLSFVDPDNLIKRNDLGRVLVDIADVDECLPQLVTCPVEYRTRIQKFFQANFSPESCADQLIGILGE